MLDARLTVTQRRTTLRLRELLLAAGLSLYAVLCLAPAAAGMYGVAVMAAFVPLAAVALLRWPALGFWTLFAGAILIEHGITVLDQPGGVGRFWKSLDSFTPLPVPLTPALMLAFAAAGCLVLRALWGGRWPRLHWGPLLLPLAALSLAVMYGLVRGLTFYHPALPQPFDLRAAFSEMNAFPFLPLMYLLGHNALRSRRDLRRLIWVLAIALGIKALEMDFQAVRRGSAVLALNELAGHESSLMLNGFVVLGVAVWLLRGSSRLQKMAIALMPFVALALVLNKRRTGFIVLALALVFGALLLLTERGLRRRVLPVVVLTALVSACYVAVFWDSRAPVAQPVQAVRSVVEPTSREDFLSNQFRSQEKTNIERTIQYAPVTGIGFGRQYESWVRQHSLDATGATYWRFIPHNQIYWLWIKMGPAGFVAFWYVMGSALILASLTYRRLHDPDLKALALVIAGMVAMQMVFSYGDGMLNVGRNMAFLGGLFGALASLWRLANSDAETEPAAAAHRHHPGRDGGSVQHGRRAAAHGQRGHHPGQQRAGDGSAADTLVTP